MDDYNEIEIHVLTEEDVQEVVDNALRQAETTYEELQQQAKAGRFTSEMARRTWVAVSTLVP